MPPPPGGAGVGSAASPGPMAGSAAHGMTGVKIGLEALQKALPSIPLGSELHNDLMKAISSISKHIASDQGSGQGSNQIQQLMELIRAAKTGGAQPNMAAMMPPGGGGAGAPPPPMAGGAVSPPSTGPM